MLNIRHSVKYNTNWRSIFSRFAAETQISNLPSNLKLDERQDSSSSKDTFFERTEGEIMVGTWLGECCRQVEAEEVSNSRNKIHQTMYRPLFPPLYYSSLRTYYSFIPPPLEATFYGNCRTCDVTYLQSPSLRPFLGVSFVPAVAYHFCLNFPAAFSQPGNGLSDVPCNSMFKFV